jgi:uncharacterized OsmC-like protein
VNPGALKELFDRWASAMARHPAFARGSGHARVRLDVGLGCDVELEGHTLRVDQPTAEGGGATGPDPGQLLRASLGASLAMGCRIWGARLGVAIEAIEVELTCDYDARGPLGVAAEVPVGWSQIRFDVTVTTEAPDEDVRRVVERAGRLSPMLANLAPAVRRVERLTIVRPEVPAVPAARERAVPSEVTPWFSKSNQPKQRKSS